MLYLFGYCFCFELNLLMGKALKSETRNDYDMTGDSVILKMNLVLSSVFLVLVRCLTKYESSSISFRQSCGDYHCRFNSKAPGAARRAQSGKCGFLSASSRTTWQAPTWVHPFSWGITVSRYS